MSAIKRNALGKGLGALLEDHQSHENHGRGYTSFQAGGMYPVLVSQIQTNPFQPRTLFREEELNELADSIRIQGIIQPITVRRLEQDKFQLISGERRLRASKIAGLTEIPAYVRTANDQEMLEMALIENVHRENLNAMEVALSFQRMIDECHVNQEELGVRVSKSRSTVTNFLRLLKLPPAIQAAVRDQKISMGHAKAIIGVNLPDHQLWLYNEIIAKDLSVRKTEALARQVAKESNEKKEMHADEVPFEYKKTQEKLSSYFGTKVNIVMRGKTSGKIEVPFLSTPDLNRIIEMLDA